MLNNAKQVHLIGFLQDFFMLYIQEVYLRARPDITSCSAGDSQTGGGRPLTREQSYSISQNQSRLFISSL